VLLGLSGIPGISPVPDSNFQPNKNKDGQPASDIRQAASSSRLQARFESPDRHSFSVQAFLSTVRKVGENNHQNGIRPGKNQ